MSNDEVVNVLRMLWEVCNRGKNDPFQQDLLRRIELTLRQNGAFG